MIAPYYQQDGQTIYCGDCREILPQLDKVDLVLTDPPYGIGLDYGSAFQDDESYVESLVREALPLMFAKSQRSALTCGVKNLYRYPQPDWVMAWISTAGAGTGPWGFCCWQPILVYGRDPYLASMSGSLPDIFLSNETTKLEGHPCIKPIGLWQKIMHRCSQAPDETILDPFMGSGTTLVAAKRLGRKAIGIEIEEKYCAIAVGRLRQSVMDLKV